MSRRLYILFILFKAIAFFILRLFGYICGLASYSHVDINVRENRRAIKKSQSRETVYIGYRKHRTKTTKPNAQTQHRKPNRWATRTETKTGGKSKLQRKQLLHRIMSLIGRGEGLGPI